MQLFTVRGDVIRRHHVGAGATVIDVTGPSGGPG